MAKNFGPGVVGGVVLIDPVTGLPYKAVGGGVASPVVVLGPFDPIPEGTPVPAIIVRLVDTPTTDAQILGVASGTTSSRTEPLDLALPGDIPTGAWMLFVLIQSNTELGLDVPAWEPMLTPTNMGSRRASAYATVKDSETVTIDWPTTATAVTWAVVWGIGGMPPTGWVPGTAEQRAAYGSSPRNWSRAPSVISEGDALALTIAWEVTNAIEDPPTILSVDNGSAEVIYVAQNEDHAETIWIGSKSITAGPTGITTVLHRNPHDANGLGMHILIPSKSS